MLQRSVRLTDLRCRMLPIIVTAAVDHTQTSNNDILRHLQQKMKRNISSDHQQ